MLRWLVAPCVTLTAGRDIQDFSRSFRIPLRIKLTWEERDGSSKTARRQTGAMRDTLRARSDARHSSCAHHPDDPRLLYGADKIKEIVKKTIEEKPEPIGARDR